MAQYASPKYCGLPVSWYVGHIMVIVVQQQNHKLQQVNLKNAFVHIAMTSGLASQAQLSSFMAIVQVLLYGRKTFFSRNNIFNKHGVHA